VEGAVVEEKEKGKEELFSHGCIFNGVDCQQAFSQSDMFFTNSSSSRILKPKPRQRLNLA
jgi:hypothetical protein